ncbi:hypothetical protein CYMTET_35574 [Cymbomonas tetramitiformis]|uniref:Uncharacterized protein n=1 Tax=Cymbomonas tetramitiformis TaxID=36881 RepID=A0AAE0F8V2_9CHLO|nr:hypothetical protein CYMTET_35574 [Cymbomonas tetramitiformis]
MNPPAPQGPCHAADESSAQQGPCKRQPDESLSASKGRATRRQMNPQRLKEPCHCQMNPQRLKGSARSPSDESAAPQRAVPYAQMNPQRLKKGRATP